MSSISDIKLRRTDCFCKISLLTNKYYYLHQMIHKKKKKKNYKRINFKEHLDKTKKLEKIKQERSESKNTIHKSKFPKGSPGD